MKIRHTLIACLAFILLVSVILVPGSRVPAMTDVVEDLAFPDVSGIEDNYLTTLDAVLEKVSTDSEYAGNSYRYEIDVPAAGGLLEIYADYRSFTEDDLDWGPVRSWLSLTYQLEPTTEKGLLSDADFADGVQPLLDLADTVLGIDADVLLSLILKSREQGLDDSDSDFPYYSLSSYDEFEGSNEEVQLLQNVDVSGSSMYYYEPELEGDWYAEDVMISVALTSGELPEEGDLQLKLGERILGYLLDAYEDEFPHLKVTRSATNMQTLIYIQSSVSADSAAAFDDDGTFMYETELSHSVREEFPEPYEYSGEPPLESIEEANELFMTFFLEQLPEVWRNDLGEKIRADVEPLFGDEDSMIEKTLVNEETHSVRYSHYATYTRVIFSGMLDAEGKAVE